MLGRIHEYKIVGMGGASVTVTSEGHVVRTGGTQVTVLGSVDELSSRDVVIAAQNNQTHDIACRAPLDTVVSDRDEVIVTVPERLAGRYNVDVVRTLRTHLRILCTRFTLRDTP